MMRLFAMYGVLGAMVADQMHHAVHFARMCDTYRMNCRAMMGYPHVVVDNGWRSRQRCKCELAGLKIGDNSLCLCCGQKAKSCNRHTAEHQ